MRYEIRGSEWAGPTLPCAVSARRRLNAAQRGDTGGKSKEVLKRSHSERPVVGATGKVLVLWRRFVHDD